MEALELRPLDVSAREDFRRCLHEFDGRDYNLRHFDWQYVANPAGQLRGHGAFMADRLAAIHVVSPVRFQVGDEEPIAAQSMNTVTLPAVQGRGLFKTLGRRTYDGLAEEGRVKFTYGFPNANSCPGFVKYLGWTLLDPAPFLFRLLRTSFLTRRLGLGGAPAFKVPALTWRSGRAAGWRTEWVERVPAGIDELWRSFKTLYRVGLVRDERYLRWRYEQRPETDYGLVVTRDESGGLRGFGALRVADKHGGRIGYVMEILAGPDDRVAYALTLEAIMRRALDEGAEMLLAWVMGHFAFGPLYWRQGFHPLPRSIWPIELHFGFSVHDESYRAALSDRRAWHLSYSDSDTV